MLSNSETPIEEKLASSFELSDSNRFTNYLVAEMETDKRVVLQPGFILNGSFVAGFVKNKTTSEINIRFSFVSRMAKLLQNYTTKIVVVISGEHGTGNIELISYKNTELDFSLQKSLNYDENFRISRVEVAVNNVIKSCKIIYNLFMYFSFQYSPVYQSFQGRLDIF